MIGGTDVLIHCRGLQEIPALEIVVRCARRRWPEAVIEGSTGNRFQTYAEIPFGTMTEIFIYRDEKAHRSWKDFGADPSNLNLMVQAIVLGDDLTVVVDDVNNPTMKTLLDEVRSFLEGPSHK